MRYAAGMLNGWAMQSLASVSGISGGEVYGVSMGNQANSRKRDNTLSDAGGGLFPHGGRGPYSS